MTRRVEDPLGYHPVPHKRLWRRGQRRVEKRLTAILRHADLRNKSVLDLGCSGGYFSFSLSRIARYVLAIDADAEIIRRNQKIAAEYGYGNITFLHANITAELVESMPWFDVTLFLSVYHHMLTASQAYDWNKANTSDDVLGTMTAIRAKTQVLIFEMGYPDEGQEWCERLPEMAPTPREWIIQNIFASDFDRVQVVPAPDYEGLWGGVKKTVAQRRIGISLIARVLRRLFSIDARDGRDIFIGTKDSTRFQGQSGAK